MTLDFNVDHCKMKTKLESSHSVLTGPLHFPAVNVDDFEPSPRSTACAVSLFKLREMLAKHEVLLPTDNVQIVLM